MTAARGLAVWLLLAAAIAVIGCRGLSGHWPGQRALEKLCTERGICL